MSRTKTKRYLVLLAAVGLVAAALGGTGTFASFSAETTNNGNYFATGTLLLHNTSGATTCTSEADPSNANANNLTTNGCSVLFKTAPLNDASPQWAKLTLANAGSVDAADIKFDEPTGCANPTSSTFGPNTLSAGLSGSVTSLSLTSLTGGSIVAGDPILVAQGSNSQTFTATADVAASATPVSVPVQTVTANFSYTTAATAKNSPSFGSGNLCGQLQFIIVETDSTFNGNVPAATGQAACSYGVPNVANPGPNSGCTFSPSTNLSNLPDASANPLLMQPLLKSNGTSSQDLLAGASRYFFIGVEPIGTLGNTFQNRRAQFALHWQIDQA